VTVKVPDGAKLDIASYTVISGSGSLTVYLPDQGDYTASLDADPGSVTVILPASLEARVTIDNDLGKVDVENGQLKPVGDQVWETSGFSSASDRADMTIKAGSGSVTVQ